LASKSEMREFIGTGYGLLNHLVSRAKLFVQSQQYQFNTCKAVAKMRKSTEKESDKDGNQQRNEQVWHDVCQNFYPLCDKL